MPPGLERVAGQTRRLPPVGPFQRRERRSGKGILQRPAGVGPADRDAGWGYLVERSRSVGSASGLYGRAEAVDVGRMPFGVPRANNKGVCWHSWHWLRLGGGPADGDFVGGLRRRGLGGTMGQQWACWRREGLSSKICVFGRCLKEEGQGEDTGAQRKPPANRNSRRPA